MEKKSGRIWVVGVSAPAIVTGILTKRRRWIGGGLQGPANSSKNRRLRFRGPCALASAAVLATGLAGTGRSQAPQEPTARPALEYAGKPIAVPFQCSADDVQWAGLVCSDSNPCPVYLELSAVEGIGDRVVVAGNFHSEAVTLFSLLLASDDGGRVWREPFERIRGAGLDRVVLAEGDAAWASGSELFPLTMSPFLLFTSDGKAWKRKSLFDEPTGGSIREFHFEGAREGVLVVDRGRSAGNTRFQRFESIDGGETWSLKEGAAEPPKLRAGEPSLWRLRDDAASRAVRVERNSGGQWATVASFAVAAAPCKPDQPDTPHP